MTDTGMQLRNEGQAAVIAADTAAHRDYRRTLQAVLDDLIAARLPFTADDVRRIALERDPCCAPSPNLLPALIGSAARHHRIIPAGWINSSRPTRHASRNRLWVGA